MSEPYTPTAREVRAAFGAIFIESRREQAYAEFDAWLSEHDRQVAERAWDSGFSAGQAWEGDVNSRVIPQMTRWDNPHRAAKGEQE